MNAQTSSTKTTTFSDNACSVFESIEQRLTHIITRLDLHHQALLSVNVHLFGSFPESIDGSAKDPQPPQNGAISCTHEKIDAIEKWVTQIENEQTKLTQL